GGDGQDDIKSIGSVKVIDGNFTKDEIKRKIAEIIKSEKPLSIENKNKVMDLFKDSEKSGSFKDLINDMNESGSLKSTYRALGTLVNQGEAGAVTSSLLTIFTFGLSMVSEAKMNKAFD